MKARCRVLKTRCRALAIVSCLLGSPCGLPAAEPDLATQQNLRQAMDSVSRALTAEAEGDLVARQRLLAEAELAGDFAPAKWQRGQMLQADGTWADVATSMQDTLDDKTLARYERLREKTADNFQNQLSMAQWCAKQRLFGQSRAHLSRALEFQPDNAQVRQSLGYRYLGDAWVSPSEVVEFSRRAQATNEALSKYGTTLRNILAKVTASSQAEHDRGVAELIAITDPAAVPAVESVFASPALEPSRAAIAWLGNINCFESSQGLARYSLAHPDASMRKLATSQLKQRPLHDFVPDMLKMLVAPVGMLAVPQFNLNGRLAGYRHAFAQEKFDKLDIAVVDHSFQREAAQTVSLGQTVIGNVMFAVAMDNLVEQSLQQFAVGDTVSQNALVRRTNTEVEQRNERIATILSTVAELEFSADPKPMWKWWDKYNETNYQAYKPERYVRSALTNRVPQYRPASAAGECFVAGTPVVTRRGMKPIERIAVGDTVLSRSVSTGELSWKPVLRATTRPAEPTRIISIDEEDFRCTMGHLFWVSGAGWMKASELKSGDILHAAEEPVVVSDAKLGSPAATFNLEVADNANYFVGKAMLMTHDVTPRISNRQLVPGQLGIGQLAIQK